MRPNLYDCLSDKQRLAQDIYEARQKAYHDVFNLNRKERRTAKGKLLVAQAEIEALKAELEVIKKYSDVS